MSSHPLVMNPRQGLRAILFALLLSVVSAASVSRAQAQDFSLSPSALQPASVGPGGSAISTIDLEPTGGFDSLVSLSCAVTSNQVTSNPPVCVISPTSQTPPADGPSLTITTAGATLPGLYTITVTGTSGVLTHSVTLTLSVVDLTEDYTLSVLPTTATPSPVPAGSPATTIVTVSPIGSYTGTVTLACLSVTPIVSGAPVCAFQPPSVAVTSGIPPSSTLTITTFGAATTTTQLLKPRMFYALWLAVPGLALVGVGATGARRRKLLGFLLLLALASGLILMPACSSTSSSSANSPNEPNGEITPNNTYIFTLTGVDQNGAGPSNSTTTTTTGTTTTTTTSATVTLEVN